MRWLYLAMIVSLIVVGILYAALFARVAIHTIPKPCESVLFDKPVTFSYSNGIEEYASGNDSFLFRMQTHASTVLVAGVVQDTSSEEKVISTLQYAIDFSRRKHFKVISKSEWDTARDIAVGTNDVDLAGDVALSLNRGDLGELSGRKWAGKWPALSLDRRYAAVTTYTGLYRFGFLQQSMNHGLFFWDVIDIRLRKRLFSVKGIYLGMEPSEAAGQATWLPGNRLFLAPDSNGTKTLLCPAV